MIAVNDETGLMMLICWFLLRLINPLWAIKSRNLFQILGDCLQYLVFLSKPHLTTCRARHYLISLIEWEQQTNGMTWPETTITFYFTSNFANHSPVVCGLAPTQLIRHVHLTFYLRCVWDCQNSHWHLFFYIYISTTVFSHISSVVVATGFHL